MIKSIKIKLMNILEKLSGDRYFVESIFNS